MRSVGSSFFSQCASVARFRPLTARNWSDSGRPQIISSAIASGTIPPKTNTDRQPKAGIIHRETIPASAAPNVKPTVMHIMNVTRLRFGLNSPMSAVAFGMMQPMPIPAMNRSHSSCCTFCAKAVAIAITEKNSVAPISTGRRPILSATMLNTSEPISTPKLAAANTPPSTDRGTPQSWTTAGAT